jgi:hypothetical protein
MIKTQKTERKTNSLSNWTIVLDDNHYTNRTWAEVSCFKYEEVHVMEVEFLSNMRYNLFVSEDAWDAWITQLAKYYEYYERASLAGMETYSTEGA